MVHNDFEKYAFQKSFDLSTDKSWDKVFYDVLKDINKENKNIKFLDYGCGDGKYFKKLISLGLLNKNIHGVEVSKNRIKRCHAINFKNAIMVDNVPKLPYKDNEFHVINFMEVIEHIPKENIDLILKEIRRVLKQNGFLIISTPNYPIKRFYDIFNATVYFKYKRFFDDPTHISQYSFQELKDKLKIYFSFIESKNFKDGFLYKYFENPFFKNKILYICKI